MDDRDNIPPDEAKRLIENDLVRRAAETDRFVMEMRKKHLEEPLHSKINGSVERLKIMCDLRAIGGYEAEVADLARYGAIMLHKHLKKQLPWEGA